MTDYMDLALKYGGFTSLDKVYLENTLSDLSDNQKLAFITPPPSVINAYFAEIYRSGIAAIPVGQYEAARMLGYSKTQTFAYIVMPQVIKRIIPPVANETITLVKDTSLAFTLAVAEVFTVTKQLVASQSSVVPFIVAGIFYYIFNLIVAVFFDYLEKKMDYYR